MTSTFTDDAKRLFGSSNLYEILQLHGTNRSRADLTQDEIKKAFFKQSLKFHPDRCSDESDKQATTEKFQIISRAYYILSDEEKRKIYDETGILDDIDVNGEDDANWRCMFPKITIQQLEKFINEYRESGEEREAIKESYLKHKGAMAKIMDDILGITYEDEDRIRNIIDEMIATNELKRTRNYINESKKSKEKRRKAAEKEAKEADKVLREIEANEGTSDLKALIQKRQLDRDSFFDSLAAKYAPQSKPKKRKKTTK